MSDTHNIRMPTLHTAGLTAAEAAINAALRLSPHSQQALAEQQGQVLELECTQPPIRVFFETDAQGTVHLHGAHEGPVATSVIGSAEDFRALAQADDPAAALINGNIQLKGSSAVLIDMQRAFNDLDIDWEAPLADVLGDVAGHQLAQMLRAVFAWSQDASGRLRRQLSEFALEEARLSPPRMALEGFFSDVQQLTDRSERLAQRTELLRQRLERLQEA
ncbi:MAG: SCP2 domain-containing protein [Congregibacter sp.]